MQKVQTQTDAFNLLTPTAMRALHQSYTLCASNAILICGLLISSYGRFTERNDTYIFVPEGDAQSLTVNRSSGELSLNCRSYLSEIYDTNTECTCSTYILDSTFGAPFGHCNLWDRRFNFPINMYKPPSSVVESY